MNVVLFGLAGHGKSSIANMLISGDTSMPFTVNDSAVGIGANVLCASTNAYTVYDTVGLGELSSNDNSHENAVQIVRDYFSRTRVPLNYICYVKKKGRIKEEDRRMFAIFKEIFNGEERNFVIIITHSSQEWINRNNEALKRGLGDHEFIGVNFPFNDEYDALIQQAQRMESLRHLNNTFLSLQYRTINFRIENSFQKKEEKFAKVITFVPAIGTAYRLISAGVYYAAGKPATSEERLPEGPVKGLLKLGGEVASIVILKKK